MYTLDHILWATPDLATGKRDIEILTGSTVTEGGVHPGGGTRNALLSFGDRRYLEVIAPDPRQDPRGTPAEWMGKLRAPGVVTWAVSGRRLERLLPKLPALAIATKGVLALSRRTPEGGLLEWKVLRLASHGLGPVVPFFIDWGTSKHPSESLAPTCRLEGLDLVHLKAAAVRQVFEALEIGATVVEGKGISLSARIACPRGAVTLIAADPLPAGWRDA